MAKIVVNEKDMSWYYRTRDPGVLTVLTPILSNWGPYTPTLVNFDNFKDVYGDSVDAQDLSYPIAYSLAKSGVTILGTRINLGALGSAWDPNAERGTSNGWSAYDDGYGVGYPGREKPAVAIIGTTLDYSIAPLYIKAKYTGSYGNNIKVVCRKCTTVPVKESIVTLDSVVSFMMWLDVKDAITNKPLETLVYEFVDRNSAYYWEEVNRKSQYIEVYAPTLEEGTSGIYGTQVDVAALTAYANTTTNAGLRFADITLTGGTDASIYNETTNPDGLWVVDEDTGEGSFKYNEQLIGKAVLLSGLAGDEDAKPYPIYSTYTDLRDLYNVDFDVALSGGYNYLVGTDNALDIYFISLVKSRGTAIYLVDSYLAESAKEFFDRCGTEVYDSATNYDTGIAIPGSDPAANYKIPSYSGASSYCAAYGPWGYAQLLATGQVRALPGSYVMLTAWARALTNGSPAYLAPAGVSRASLGEIVSDTIYPVGSAVIDSWQNQDWYNTEAGYKVNPIARLRSYGYVVYGNSTLLKSDPITGATSMLQSVSTRIVANMIKRRAFDVCLSLQFDQIDDKVFAAFNAEMGSFMNELKYGGALYSYRIVANYADMTYDNLNQRTIPIKILISPNPAAENFIIDLEIHPSGITFGDDTPENSQLPLQ